MTMYALTNARHTARLARQYAALSEMLSARGDRLEAALAYARSCRLAQVAAAWEVVS